METVISTRRAITLCAGLLFITACGGDDIPTGPGAETHVPTTQPGPGAETTSTTCSASDPCDYWFCRCDDGAVVNAAFCDHGLCSEASAICPAACSAFDHGSWTGIAGGGPAQPSSTCGGLGSSNPTCDACFVDRCCGEGSACGGNNYCLDHWDCVVACNGNASCRYACDAEANPDGRAAYEALESCLLGDCAGACGS